MKNINEYLSTKIKDKTYLSSFPTEPNYKEIEDFLLRMDFAKHNATSYTEFVNMTDNRYRVCTISSQTGTICKEICICKNGKANEENPMYTVIATEDGTETLVGQDYYKYLGKIETYTNIIERFTSYDKFRKALIDYFEF